MRRLSSRLLGLAATGLVTVAGCTVTDVPGEEATSKSRQGIQGGAIDEAHTFAVSLSASYDDQWFSYCSGTLIAPNLVVTARHCVDDVPHEIRCATDTFGEQLFSTPEMFVTTVTDVNTATVRGAGAPGWHGVKQIVRPDTNEPCGADIALLILGDLVAPSEATPATPGVQVDMGDARYSGKYAAIGYGVTSPDGDDTGTRRILEDIAVQCIPNDATRDCPDDWSESDKEFIGGDGVCPGDSGSGAFEKKSLASGSPVSLGILSRGGDSVDGALCAISIYTRLDAYGPLVVAAARKASNDWQLYPEPAWTAGVGTEEEDAGAPDAAPAPSPKAPHGGACTTSDDCADGLCLASGSGGTCAQTCTVGKTTCPAGTTCSAGACVAKKVTAQEAKVKTVKFSHTCAASAPGAATSGTGVFMVALAAAGLSVGRRRRRG